MKKITIFDTSIGSRNIGDEIIVDSIKRELNSIFNQNTMFFNIPTHEIIGKYSRNLIKDSNFSFVAGTNLLSSRFHIFRPNQWNISLMDVFSFERVILMGVGWTYYQSKPTSITKFIYNKAFDKKFIHSVRDNYTKEKLKEIGIKNVINTGCPTMWKLTPEHCKRIPRKKAKNVVVTLTDYRTDIDKDKMLINYLKKNYENVYFWVQGSRDKEYFLSISDIEESNIINPTLKSYDELLDSNLDLDYVGTRLHAGIRALQKGRRSLIIGIDNRALEMKKDFNLPVLEREKIDQLENYINNEINTEIKMNFDLINEWKNQFKG